MKKSQPRPQWTQQLADYMEDELSLYPDDEANNTLYDKLERAMQDVFCTEFGHEIENDMCMIPSHRYCVYCRRGACGTCLGTGLESPEMILIPELGAPICADCDGKGVAS
jgi:hypothetical protein